MSQETTTQLADNRPQFDCALRVALPGNVPQRLAKKGRDELIRANAFSPAAFSSGRKTFEILAAACQKSSSSIISEEVENVSHLLDSKIIDSISRDADADIKTTIRDLSVLALSSRRANQKDVEATAYLSLGVIHDNLGSYHAAIENYMQYLQICQEVNDIMGSALACNCLGVDYMTLVNSNSDGGTVEGVKQTENLVSDLNRAIEFHQKHLEIGPDDGGRFVANTNLGLCYGIIGDIVQSAKHQQDALRTAIKMQTLYGQSIAVGNLGMLAMMKQDFATAHTCFEQHLQLVQTLSNPEGEVGAWKKLADVATNQNKWDEALEFLEQARTIAQRNEFLNELRRLHCLIAVAKGNIEFDAFTDGVANSLS